MQYSGLAQPQKQKIQLPSKFLLKHLNLFELMTDPVVDVACGYGRNAKILADLGCTVHCLDKNADALASLDLLKNEQNKLVTQYIDLTTSVWPYALKSLDAIINIHYYQEDLIECFLKSLKPGGLLLIETIDGRKGNHFQLPKAGTFHAQLKERCDFIEYSEVKLVGSNVASAKLLARTSS
jgi:SAM-dependent methyltransferase